MFAVFGMTESYAKAQAYKKCPIQTKGKHLTEAEYQDSVELFVKVLMQGKRSVQVSNEFSTLAFAKEFIVLCKKDGGERLTVKAHVKDYSTKTLPNAKRDYKLRWVELDEYEKMPGAVKR